MKKKLSIATALIILVLISAFLYFRTTPQYSLYQLAQAYKTRDIALAKEYVDVDSLSNQLAEEAIKTLREEINKPSDSQNEWEKLGQEIGSSLVESFMPSLEQKIKDEFKKSFTEGVEGKSEPNKNFPNFKPLAWRDFLPGGRIKIKQAGAIRLLTIPNQEGDALIFRMRHEDGKWRIVGWENFGEIAKNLAKEDLSKESSKSKNAKFGERVDLSQGWFLTVSKPEKYIPSNEFERAELGKELEVIEVTYENTGKLEGSYDPSNFELKDKENHRYKRKYSGKEPLLDSGVLPFNQKAKGFITYEVVENSDIVEVIYNSSSVGSIIFGFGN